MQNKAGLLYLPFNLNRQEVKNEKVLNMTLNDFYEKHIRFPGTYPVRLLQVN